MMPVKKMTDGCHFKQVCDALSAPTHSNCPSQISKMADDGSGVQQAKQMWIPCSPGDPGAMEMRLRELDPKLVTVPPVSMVRHCMLVVCVTFMLQLDFCIALRATSPSVTDSENEKYIEYKKMMDKE